MEHEVAVMVVLPRPTRVAKPFVPALLLMVATLVFDEDQVTEPVMSWPLEPVAVNCWDPADKATVWLRGLIVMDVVLPQTVTLVEPLTVPDAAVMVAVPEATPVTRPVLLLTVATLVADDDQLAAIGEVVPSLKVPVAVSCTVAPTLIDGVSGVTVIAVNAGFTQKPAQPTTSANRTVAKLDHSSLDHPR